MAAIRPSNKSIQRDPMTSYTLSMEGENFTETKLLKARTDYSISGTFTGTISWQRALDGRNWHTIGTFTAPQEGFIEISTQGILHRFAVTEVGTGTAKIVLVN